MSQRQQSRRPRRPDDQRQQRRNTATEYTPPRLLNHGSLGALVRGASWKGIDSVGELDPDQGYPG